MKMMNAELKSFHISVGHIDVEKSLLIGFAFFFDEHFTDSLSHFF